MPLVINVAKASALYAAQTLLVRQLFYVANIVIIVAHKETEGNPMLHMSAKQTQRTLNFHAEADHLAGFRAGFKDKRLKPNASHEYRRGYQLGRARRDKSL